MVRERIGKLREKHRPAIAVARLCILGLLCVIAVIWWIRTIAFCDWLYFEIGATACGVVTFEGQISFFETSQASIPDLIAHRIASGSLPRNIALPGLKPRSYFSWENTGLIEHDFVVPTSPVPYSQGAFHGTFIAPASLYGRRIMLPSYLGAILLGLMLTMEIVRFSRQRKLEYRRTNGLCIGCGYDMRASPERCPDCGREREASKKGTISYAEP